MSDSVAVVLNGISQLEYDRSAPLPERQGAYLDAMDRKMDQGILLGGETLAAPNPMQRAQFVAVQLIQAVIDGNETLAAATCAYLANRLPDLKQVKVEEREDGNTFDLVFDRPHQKEVQVTFPGIDLGGGSKKQHNGDK